jgi:ribosomal protein S18 acetylase RimI-like enzyme
VPEAAPQQVNIRRATARDNQGILNCLSCAFARYQHFYTPAAFRDTVLTPELLQQRLKGMSVFVAETGSGQIVGTIACGLVSQLEGHVRGMGMLPEWQGCGIAKRLLDCAQSELKEFGCERITLDTTEPLVLAMRFYERNGFRRTGKVSDFFGMRLIEYAKEIS